jgi:serine-type D-Ala-D-Ala carboxypeptidase (penicillin-binding protein 5/6)
VRPRLNPTKAVTTLIMLVLVLVLVSGPVGVEHAGAGEQPGGQRPSGPPVPEPPELDVEAWVLMDTETGLYLTGDNADEQVPIGSVNKIMTALVVLEEGVDLDEEVTVSEEAESFVGTTYSNVGLIRGERVTVRDLLVASLIPSGTDAVYALAEYVGGGSVENFVEMMNDQASSMGLENSHFESPAGLDTTGNYSSARDLAITARAALEYPLFAEIVDTTDATISTQNREIEIFNTNQLLTTYPPTTGVKTGTTPQAGANLVASAEANEESYIGVILGAVDSDERFQGAQAILEYGFGRYDREPLVSQDEVYEELTLPYRRGQSVELVAAEDVAAPVDRSSEVELQATTEEAPSSAEAGEELGEVEVFVDGQSVGSSPLLALEGYEEASVWQMIWYGIQWLFDAAWNAIDSLFDLVAPQE